MGEQVLLRGNFDIENTYKRYQFLQRMRKVIRAPPLSMDPLLAGSFLIRNVENELENIQFYRTGSVNVNSLNDFSDPLAIIHSAEVATFNYNSQGSPSLLSLKDIRIDSRTTEIIANGRVHPSEFTNEYYDAYEELERFRYCRILDHFRPSNVQARLEGLKNGSWDLLGRIWGFEDSVKKWVEVLDEIPRTPSKNQRRRVELRQELHATTDIWLKSEKNIDEFVQALEDWTHG